MPHKIEISDRTYQELKDYCTLNKIKIGQYADKLIYDGLMIEKYGDTPFTNYRKKIMQEFPPEKFEQEYMAQPEPIPERFISPEPVEKPTKVAQAVKDVFKQLEETADKFEETLKEKELQTKEPIKIIRRRLK